jgi:hypothetical protein
MAPPDKEQSGGFRISGTTAAAAIGVGLLGAVASYFWGKNDAQQEHQSHSGYVVYSSVKVTVFVRIWPAVESLS